MSSDLPSDPPHGPDQLPPPVRSEASLIQALMGTLGPDALDWPSVVRQATPWVTAVRAHPAPFWALESLLREYPLSSAEGLALMRLAEALLRVPDTATAAALMADQLGRAGFDAGDGTHPVLARLAAQAIELSRHWLPEGGQAPSGLLQRWGAQAVVGAALRAIQLLGQQFVLGQDIDEAVNKAREQRAHAGSVAPRFSFDMLGEGARSPADAQRYLAAYQQAIATIATIATTNSPGRPSRPEDGDGISIKLSALDPRFEASQQAHVMARLLPRLQGLMDAAAQANLNLTIDAEESDRLELTLALLQSLAATAATRHPGWQGLGLAIQAYQQRAPEMVNAVVALARRHGLRLMVRLVKGAYWDGEIKRAQELGLDGYPVWTHKSHTDLAYLACARVLLANADVIYPQFATHNAATIAAVRQLAQRAGVGRDGFELQRLHGMGEGIYREVFAQAPAQTPAHSAPRLRIYAPVGRHRDLLAYLVRRLLENGANSAFVHRLSDPMVDVAVLLASPLHVIPAPGLPSPRSLYGDPRLNALGLDLACAAQRAPLAHAIAHPDAAPRPLADISPTQAEAAMAQLADAFPRWSATPLADRVAVLRRAADALEARLPEFIARLVHEGCKTWSDALSEVREAIDFCRYYAQQAERQLAPITLPGPTGERNELRLRGRGVFVCISPWNFPLAIFAGQVVAALVCGNAVAAKPAEQTPSVAQAFVALLHAAGVPSDALMLLPGPGETIGAALVSHPACAGVAFTGSTNVAKAIQRALAASDGPIVPLIAETGGLNAMIVDSSALPEQVVDAVLQSAFRSAGQRCSALRLLCLHEAVADATLELLAGAMQTLVVGDPRDWATDVGPVIDAEAHAGLRRHVDTLARQARCVGSAPMNEHWAASHIAPVAFEINQVSDLREEIFGPVLHVVRWSGPVEALMAQINALGYGLTLGIHTRIDSRAERVASLARVGNIYVNRNMVGAVVGVQPFGGQGLSGTGPKAGGPHYLARFCAEQTLTVNTAAAGGNADLLTTYCNDA